MKERYPMAMVDDGCLDCGKYPCGRTGDSKESCENWESRQGLALRLLFKMLTESASSYEKFIVHVRNITLELKKMTTCPICEGTGQAYFVDEKTVLILGNASEEQKSKATTKKCFLCDGTGVTCDIFVNSAGVDQK